MVARGGTSGELSVVRAGDNYKWRVLALFWLMYFLNQADRQVIFSVLPLVKAELALQDVQLGLFGSVFFWVYAILVPVAGCLGDVLGRKFIVLAALVVWSTATFGSGFATGFLMLIVLRGITAFGEAFYYPAANSMLSDFHGRSSRATAMAIHQTSVYVGIVASGTLSGFIGQTFGWRMAFFFFGTAGLLLALGAARWLREPVRGQSDDDLTDTQASSFERVRETLATPTALLLSLAFLGMVLVNAAYLTWTPTLLYRKFGLTLAGAGFHATFWHHAGAALGVLVGGRLADQWALQNRLSRPLTQFGGLLLGAPFIFLLGWSDHLNVVYVALGLFGLFRGVYDSNLLASLYEVIRPSARATATGIMLAFAFLGGGLGPVLTGWLGERVGLGCALSLTSCCYVAAALSILVACLFTFQRDISRIQTR